MAQKFADWTRRQRRDFIMHDLVNASVRGREEQEVLEGAAGSK
jgi:hypothetical protein